MLVVALVFSTIVAAVLASYLRLATTALNNADRSFYATAGAELAECGIEEAMAAFYKYSAGATLASAWAGWTISGNTATRTFTGFSPGPNATGVVRVFVRNYALNTEAVIVSKATVTLPRGPAIDKFVEVTARPRGLFTRGLVAQKEIICSGTVYADSWISDPDGDPATAAIPYSTDVRRPNGSIATADRAANSVELGTAAIYGTVATGGGEPHYASGSIIGRSFAGTGIDPTCISTDFTATLPAVTAPTPVPVNLITVSVTASTTFPRTGDLRNADGRYYYNFAIGAGIIFSGSPIIAINDDCVFIFNNHAGTSSIVTSGTGSITVNPGASLVIYTNGNITASGAWFINQNGQPSKAIIYGTKTGARQTVSISGVAGGGAAFYMPNADFTMAGNGDVAGSFIAHSVAFNGTLRVHYDESLASVGTGNGFAVSKWKQLNSAAERSTYAAQLNF
jgi:hypothetical protein